MGAVASLFGFYGVALPVAYSLAFFAHMKLPGIWIGLCVGYAFVSIFYLTVVRFLDWDKAAAAACRSGSQQVLVPQDSILTDCPERPDSPFAAQGLVIESKEGDGYCRRVSDASGDGDVYLPIAQLDSVVLTDDTTRV